MIEHYKCRHEDALSQVSTGPDMIIDVLRMSNPNPIIHHLAITKCHDCRDYDPIQAMRCMVVEPTIYMCMRACVCACVCVRLLPV